MADGYREGDPYFAFAKAAELVPPDATKQSHKQIRERCKAIVLGINYGMGPEAMALQAGITPAEAKELLRLHNETYRPFWRWIGDTVSAAMLTNHMQTVFGWCRRVGRDANPRSLMNFPMQANGAEMLRIAAIAATEAGIQVCAPVHDAFLIAAPLERLEDDIAAMRDIMTKAGRAVTGGLDIRTDAEVVRWPDRYMDERGKEMWEKVMSLLDTHKGSRMSRPENKVSRRCNGGVARASRWCHVGVTPFHLINNLIMSIYNNRDSTLPNQDDIKETEVETNLIRRSKIRRGERFLKGPIALPEIAAASRLPGKALAVLLAVHHQSDLTGKPSSPCQPDFLRTSALVEVPSREAYKSSKRQVSSPLLGQEAEQPESN